MVRRKAEDILGLIVEGEKLAAEKKITSLFTAPGGVVVSLAYSTPSAYRREFEAERAKVSEEALEALAARDRAKTVETKNAMSERFLAALRRPGVEDEAADALVLSRYVLGIYDPCVSSPEDPAVTLGWLVEMGVPFPPESYDPAQASAEVAATPDLVGKLMAISPRFRSFVQNHVFSLEKFYKARAEAELGNSGPPRPTTPAAESAARSAKNGSSPSSAPGRSDGSARMKKGKPSKNGKPGS